jgi:hypothetical protein
MQGSLSQSYFLWDAQSNDLARKLFYELESRPKVVEEDNSEELEEIYQEMNE